jgi:arabinogalactan endo-1,4-beta-galactosidase
MTKLPLSLLALCLVAPAFAGVTPDDRNSRGGPFILGADISWVPEDEAAGAEYYDHGVKKDIFQILKENNFNCVRLRLFVSPQSTNGYARGMSEAFCDIEHVKAMAKRARTVDMGVLLNVHLGDTWTSPGHQDKPVAWRELDFPELTNAVRKFTRDSVAALKADGTTPDMVAVGNEITDGTLFPDGRRGNFDKFAALIQAGIAGVKEVDPTIKIMLHHHLGRSNERVRDWVDNFLKRGTRFDVIGLSCYAQAQEGDWKKNFEDLAARYPQLGIIAVEYSARKRHINDLVFNTPDKKGLGTFIWEPTRHREALFNKDGRNAGGGQESNFTADEGINQGARINRNRGFGFTNNVSGTNALVGAGGFTNRLGTNDAGRAEWRRRRNGGRYDVNELMSLYPQMARDYGNVTTTSNSIPVQK